MNKQKLPWFIRLFLTVGGTGSIFKGGGTLASLIALPLAWVLAPYPLIAAAIIIIITVAGIWLSSYAQKKGWEHDDSRITVDEFCGMLVALLILPTPASIWGKLIIYLIGFVLFRALDIIKFPPVSWAEKLPGGWGVMADDLVAAVLTNGLLRLIMLIPVSLIYGY